MIGQYQFYPSQQNDNTVDSLPIGDECSGTIRQLQFVIVTPFPLNVLHFQDWTLYTSKGCFFYEDNEIVTHVYSLKMTTTSTVYIAAYPINEPECCKYLCQAIMAITNYMPLFNLQTSISEILCQCYILCLYSLELSS